MGTNTGLGIGIGIPFKNNALGGDKPYFPPELKARMIGVWTNYGKKNTDADRNIIKNKIPNAGGDLEILNAAYKLNSGFGEYKVDFLDWTINSPFINERTSFTFSSFNDTNNDIITVYQRVPAVVQSFKIKAKLRGRVLYRYYVNNGDTISVSYYEVKEGINILPDSADPTSVNGKVGFVLKGLSSIKVELIPNFEDAFVTDGINDIIASIKTLEEWNIGNKGITIVSMIHQINTNTNNFITTNNIRTDNKVIGRNIVSNIEKTGIYGWYKENIQSDTINVINNILGDKNDYTSHSSPSTNINPINNSKFYVQGYAVENGFNEISSIAHYWTFAVLGKATEDEINLIIGNYNLDRSLKPDILCNIGKQGITNDNHADFNDKLVDYSGNGRDIQMNNLAWKGGSGIAAKPFETIKDYTIVSDEARQKLTIYNEFSYKVKSNTPNRYWTVQSIIKDNTSYQVTIITDKDCYWINATSFTNNEGNKESIRKEYPVKANTPTQVTICGLNEFEYPEDIEPTTAVSYVNLNYAGEVTVTFIPSCKGGLLLDGVNDFGQFVGDLGLKDYTLIMNRAYNNLINNQVPLISSNIVEDQTPFIVEHWNTGSNAISFSYGASRTTDIPLDINKKIVYQSTYSYMGYVIPKGNAISTGNGITLGKFGNGVQYSAICLWSLMLFPYSMSEFLIERQLKKHKLGTLYPDMVEFRPVIKANNDYEIVYTAIIKPNNWQEISIGDYVTVGESVAIQIKLNNPLEVTNVSSNSLADVSFYKEETGDNVYTIYGRLLDGKSPQKITMTIEQDENYVKFEPVITSNVEYARLYFYLNNYQKRINIGDYIPKDAYIRANFYLKNNVDELTVFTFNGVNINYRRSPFDDTAFNIGQIYNYNFPQEVNITIDEYIRFEDIVQPYPALLRFNDENGNEVSWGGKFKVGSTITRIGSAADSNLLPNIYNIFGLLLNGNQVTSSKVIVEKTMVFKAKSAYIFDNNEPKCILSPRLLRIPNSSYKILGHIPDISGHGNNGKINNSAYKLNSGVNGYLVDFTTLKDDGIKGIVRTDSKIYLDKSFNYNQGFWLGRTNNPSPAYKVKVSGIPETGMLTYTGGVWLNLVNGINELPARTNTEEEHGFVIQSPNLDWSNLVIEQIGEYEGAYCLDGVDDFVTIPTIVGGKQVLMKMNWQNRTGLLYDQRKNGSSIDAFAILNVNSNNSIAYNSRNTDGETYIDGILNKNIVCPQLYKITHSITIINQLANKEEVISPTIGSDTTHKIYFSQMSLYDFMLFDNISTDDKIKELNEYVGIEAKVELPPYYWDAYGKSNLDEDRDSIKQRGVAVGDYDLTNTNFAYDKISGYGGYSFKSFNDSQDWNIRGDGTGVEIVSRDGYSITIKKLIQNLDWQISNNEYKYPTILDKELPFKCVSNKKVGLIWQLKYKTEGATSDTNVTLINQQLTPNVPLEINLPYKTQDELTELGAVSTSVYYLLYFSNTTLEIGEEYTVEMLPLYPNGLLYDAVTDYSENVNIPVFTDFTAIMKRKWLKNQGCPLIKGSKVYEGGNGNALLFEWDKAYNFVFYKRTDIMEGEVPDNISFITPTNYNGNVITRGSEQDTNGICIAGDGNAGFANMVFYKLILYPKTIPLLQINFLKNLMEKDEIIDLTNPIFIKDE